MKDFKIRIVSSGGKIIPYPKKKEWQDKKNEGLQINEKKIIIKNRKKVKQEQRIETGKHKIDLKNMKIKIKHSQRLKSIIQYKMCQLCTQLHQNLYSPYNCLHTFCHQCHIKFIQSRSNHLQLPICPSQNCNFHLDISKIYQLLKLYRKQNLILKIQQIIKKSIFICPVCKNNYHIQKQNNIICCGYSYCLLCKQSHLFNKPCKYNYNQQILHKLAYPCVCPNCLSIFDKDQNCNHVSCFNCKVDFCAICSAFREPILCHDNSYHRKNCRHYTLGINMVKKCLQCRFCREGNCEVPNLSFDEFLREKLEGKDIIIEEILRKKRFYDRMNGELQQ